MFSLRAIATTSTAALALFLCQQADGFISGPASSSLVRAGRSSCSPPAAAASATTRMSYAPKNVQDVWDNHFAAFGGKDVKTILLDYDETSVITTFDQTTDQKQVFEGLEGARTLFEGLFENLSDLSDLAAPMADVSEESKTVFLAWRCPASGFLDATDTFVINDETKKIYRQTVAYRTG